jgi:thiamine biosynthesis lipoprotein
LVLKKHKRATIALGTIVEVSIWLAQGEDPQEPFSIAYDAIGQIHMHMSLHDVSSDLGRFRLAYDGDIIEINAHTARVLQCAEKLWEETGGYFDVCVANTLMNQHYLPKSWLSKKNSKVSMRQPLLLSSQDGHHFLTKSSDNQCIDLGGIAKGYAVDCAIEALQQLGVPAGMVNAGGDMRIYGALAEKIHLRIKEGKFLPLCTLSNQALASSSHPGNQQNIPHDYLPIVNPHTGKLIAHHHKVMSVLADTAMMADALTKLAWLDKLDDSMLQRYNSKLIQN